MTLFGNIGQKAKLAEAVLAMSKFDLCYQLIQGKNKEIKKRKIRKPINETKKNRKKNGGRNKETKNEYLLTFFVRISTSAWIYLQ